VKPPFWVYNWYGLATNTSVGNVTGVKFMDMHFTPKTFYKKLLTDPPAEFFTLNDDFSPNPVVASAEISRLDRFLTRYYGTFPNSYKKDYSTCDLQIDRGLVDISRTNMSLFADSTLSVHILNDNIQDTLSSVEVGHWDELRPSNLVDAQGRGVDMLRSTDTIRITYFNAERGTQWKNQCAMIHKDSSLKDSPIIFFNELDVGMARSGNVDTAYELAKCLQMNYAYGIEFVELTLGQKKEINLLPRDALNNRSFHGNAILSKYPLRNVEVHQLPGTAEYWRQGGKYAEPRLGERMAIFASIPVHQISNHGDEKGGIVWIDLVSTHLDAFVGESYNIKSVQLINNILNRRDCDGVILSGDLGNRGTKLAQSASWLHKNAGFLDPVLSNTMQRGNYKKNPKGDWILFRGKRKIAFHPITESIEVVPAPRLSDHNFVTVQVRISQPNSVVE
jgi:endonuclease/exonuclease/phosphatase family metal-dependent hydrolase